jgi:hypothetical protein
MARSASDLPPGARAGAPRLSDFTEMGDLAITVAGLPLDHRLYHFRLVCSGFEHAHVILGGESYVALAEGLQNALWALGGAPREHRSDSLSAAFRNLDARCAGGPDLALRRAVRALRHGAHPQQPRRGPRERLHREPHGHLKSAIERRAAAARLAQLRDLAAYRRFIDEIVSRKNARNAKRIDAERRCCSRCPRKRTCDYEETFVRHLLGRLHAAQGVLHRAVPADRPSAAGAPL